MHGGFVLTSMKTLEPFELLGMGSDAARLISRRNHNSWLLQHRVGLDQSTGPDLAIGNIPLTRETTDRADFAVPYMQAKPQHSDAS